MTPSEIGKAYDTITHLWESEEFDSSNGIAQHQKAISFTENPGKALDIGCGCTGRIINLLIDAGFAPEGLDVSFGKIELARKKHPDITFHNEDICTWSVPEQYSFISAWDSIWHVPLDEQESVMRKIVGGLKPGGIFIFSFGGTREPLEHTDNAMGPDVYYSSLGTNGFLSLLAELGCDCKHLEFDQYPELHAYMIVQKN